MRIEWFLLVPALGLLGCSLISILGIEPYWLGKIFCNKLHWHQPDESGTHFHPKDIYFVNLKATCKYCGKEVMRDSQGNWF